MGDEDVDDGADGVVIFTFQCAIHEAWGMVRDNPDELHVFANRTPTDFDNISVEIYSSIHPGHHLDLYSLANVVRSRVGPCVRVSRQCVLGKERDRTQRRHAP